MRTVLLNYGHPLTPAQLAQIGALVGQAPDVRNIAVQFDRVRPIAEVARDLVDATDLSPREWQSRALLLNPPGLAPLAVALLAEIHGRSGHFPLMLNIRPVAHAIPPEYEVAEIVNVQALRDSARTRRPSD